MHTASPFIFSVEDNEKDLLLPAINGTLNMLKAVKENGPNVKRVVCTSSFAACVDLNAGYRVGHTYTEKIGILVPTKKLQRRIQMEVLLIVLVKL